MFIVFKTQSDLQPTFNLVLVVFIKQNEVHQIKGPTVKTDGF